MLLQTTLWVGHFIYFKFTYVFSSIKEKQKVSK